LSLIKQKQTFHLLSKVPADLIPLLGKRELRFSLEYSENTHAIHGAHQGFSEVDIHCLWWVLDSDHQAAHCKIFMKGLPVSLVGCKDNNKDEVEERNRGGLHYCQNVGTTMVSTGALFGTSYEFRTLFKRKNKDERVRCQLSGRKVHCQDALNRYNKKGLLGLLREDGCDIPCGDRRYWVGALN